MRKLFVIGNGFDLHHELDTCYQSFGMFLKEKYSNIYDYLIEFYGFDDLQGNENDDNNQLWSEFETALAKIDYEVVLESNSDYLASPGSSDFRDRDWHSFSIAIEQVVDDLTVNLFKAFKEFIISVEYPTNIGIKKLLLDPDDIYLTFNYTDTLERYYKIPADNILYIHGKADSDEETLILGHGVDPMKFETKPPEPPNNLNDEESERWYESMNEQYDYSYETGKDEMMRYFSKSFKESQKIIEENSDFFKDLDQISSVVILGHSLSEVDQKYFTKILSSVKANCSWTATHRKDKCTYEQRLVDIGVSKDRINIIKIDEL